MSLFYVNRNGNLRLKTKQSVELIGWVKARKVLVYRLLTENSIDESMLDVLDYKSEIFDLYARESEISDVKIDERGMPEDENVTKQVLRMEKERLQKEVS